MSVLTDKALASNIKSGKIDSLYLFYGRDISSIEAYTKRLISKIMPKEAEDLNLHRFTGKDFDLVRFSDSSQTCPMFCERTVIVINDLYINDFKKSDFDFFKEILKGLDETVTVIIYITGIDIYRSKTALNKEWASFSKFCEKTGSVAEFKIKTAPELAKLISSQLSKIGLSISTSNAVYLAQISICNTSVIKNELSKLIFYKQSGEITKEDIDLMCVSKNEVDSFKLASEIVSKNSDAAFLILKDLCRRPEDYIAALASVNGAFVDLYRAKLARETGATENNLIDDFSYPANLQFRAKNAYKLCKKHTLSDIRRCLSVLSEADFDLKSKRTPPDIIFQKAIAKISGIDNDAVY